MWSPKKQRFAGVSMSVVIRSTSWPASWIELECSISLFRPGPHWPELPSTAWRTAKQNFPNNTQCNWNVTQPNPKEKSQLFSNVKASRCGLAALLFCQCILSCHQKHELIILLWKVFMWAFHGFLWNFWNCGVMGHAKAQENITTTGMLLLCKL